MNWPKPPIQSPEDRKQYYQYLESYEWRQKRDAVFLRQSGICQGCECEPIEEVHHMTYTHLFDEPLFHLVGLCCNCHRKTHFIQPSFNPWKNTSA
jgi:hypothetical protein